MKAVVRDGRATYTPFSCVLPCKLVGDVTDLSFRRSESCEGRGSALVPVVGDVVLSHLQHDNRLAPPRRMQIPNSTQDVVSVFLCILDPRFLDLYMGCLRDGL